MRINHIIKVISIALLALVSCDKKETSKSIDKNYKKVTTYIQNENNYKFKYSEELFDSRGHTIQLIEFSNQCQVNYISKSHYDSIKRLETKTNTYFQKNGSINIHVYKFQYNSLNQNTKTIYVLNRDTTEDRHEYYGTGKLKSIESRDKSNNILSHFMFEYFYTGKMKSQRINNLKYNTDNIRKYFYDKSDSLVKWQTYDLNKNMIIDQTIIKYRDSSKTTFEYNSENELSNKTVELFNCGKKHKEICYCLDFISGEMEICNVKTFTYKNEKLIKKEIKYRGFNNFCNDGSKRTDVYLYEYD
jgi:hypothetical protein